MQGEVPLDAAEGAACAPGYPALGIGTRAGGCKGLARVLLTISHMQFILVVRFCPATTRPPPPLISISAVEHVF
jgi:hypothetical protein